MKMYQRFAIVCLAVFALAFGASAQTSTPSQPTLSDLGFSSFSITSSVLAIHGNGQTATVADLGQAAAITTNFSLRLDELMSSNNTNFSGYYAGFKYFLPALKPLQSTTFAPLQLYVSGEGGITRTSPSATASPVNAASGRAIFGANWNPKATGAVSFNIGEVSYGYFPGLASGHNHFLGVSAGIKISLP